MMDELPGGAIKPTRDLHFIWLADCSGSMAGEKIGMLNHAIRDVLPLMKNMAAQKPRVNLLVRAIAFSTGARWHPSAQPTSIEDFQWSDLSASGLTHMGRALEMVAEDFDKLFETGRYLAPVLVLISDGHPNGEPSFEQGLKKLMDHPLGKSAIRLAIAVEHHDVGERILARFIANQEYPVLYADNAQELTQYIEWASRSGLSASYAGARQPGSPESISSPSVPQASTDDTDGEVW